jgi:predicted GNAT family N-acyltransferase
MNEQVIEALKRSRYRVLTGREELEEVFRLRHDCYCAEQSISPNEQGIMTDPFDETDNCVHVAVDMDGKLMASVRLHLVSKLSPASPTLEVFPELQEYLDRGQTLLDPTRFVVDHSARKERLPLHFLTLRVPVMATIFYDVDIALAPVRPEHAAFYRRYLGHEAAIEPRKYPGLKKPIELLIAKREQREEVLARTPIFGPVDGIPGANIDFPILPGIAVASSGGRPDAA